MTPVKPPLWPRERVSTDEILRKFRERYGERTVAIGVDLPELPRVPTGILEFDIASGGGFPRGKQSIIWGDRDTGKSTMLYKLIATYQADHPDEVVAFQDLERNYTSPYGRAIGIDESRLLFMAPDCAEDGGEMIRELIATAPEVGLICVDTLAAMVPSKEVEKGLDEAVVGSTGLFVSRLLKVTANALLRAEKTGRPVTIVYVNQLRMKIGAMGDPSAMPGGKAPEFWSSMIVRLWQGKEKVEAEFNATRAVRKAVTGVIQKKKGPIVSKNFEYVMAIEPHDGLRVGETDDWKFAAAYLLEAGKLGKTEDGKAWQILGNVFPTKKACQDWYRAHKTEVRAALLEFLSINPEAV